ncbi:hypothetical protein OYC64_004220 [Pagothenia borchgrevinki]
MDADNRLKDTDNRLKDTDNRLKDTENRLMDTENRLMDTDNRLNDTDNRLMDTDNRLMDTDNRLKESDNRLMGTDNRLNDTDNRLMDTDNRLMDTDNRLKESDNRLMGTDNRLKESENQILELKNKEHKTVIFSAATGGGENTIGPFDTHTTLIYRTLITNIGAAYSPSTGIFTAPVPGVYYFTIFFHVGRDHGTILRLYKNNELIILTHDIPSTYDRADNGGNAVFLQLVQGDRVYVQLRAKTHVWGTDYDTTFSGFLVTEM